MENAEETYAPVKAKALLVDPESMAVVWMNEAASQDVSGTNGNLAIGMPVDQAVPMATVLGLMGALRIVADTGLARHMRTDLVSTARGSMAIAASAYRLPDGKLLLLIEHAWKAERDKKDGSAARRRGRRTS